MLASWPFGGAFGKAGARTWAETARDQVRVKALRPKACVKSRSPTRGSPTATVLQVSAEGAEPMETYEKLAISDIQNAADLFRGEVPAPLESQIFCIGHIVSCRNEGQLLPAELMPGGRQCRT